MSDRQSIRVTELESVGLGDLADVAETEDEVYMLVSRGNRKAPSLYRMMWVKELGAMAAQEVELYDTEDILRGRALLVPGTTEIRAGQKLGLLRWWKGVVPFWRTERVTVTVVTRAIPGSPEVEYLKFHPHPRPAPSAD